MKTIQEMTDSEILKLTGDELENLIKITYADNGIKLLSVPEKPALLELPKPTLKFFKVGGYYFKDSEVASQIASLMQDGYNDSYESSYKMKYPRKLSEGYFCIVPEMLYEESVCHEWSKKLLEQKQLEEIYEKQKKDYDSNYNAGSNIRQEIHDTYYAIVEKYRNLNQLRNEYKAYLELAGQDKDIAIKFLRKAYVINEFELQYIIDESWLEVPTILPVKLPETEIKEDVS